MLHTVVRNKSGRKLELQVGYHGRVKGIVAGKDGLTGNGFSIRWPSAGSVVADSLGYTATWAVSLRAGSPFFKPKPNLTRRKVISPTSNTTSIQNCKKMRRAGMDIYRTTSREPG